MDRVNERIKSIEQDCLELRLANQSFYREGVKQIKQRNQKRIFVSLILCLGVALTGGILYCQLIHCRMLS